MPRGFKLLVKSITGLAILMGLNGCIAWPVNKKGVIGIYQSVFEDGMPGLPDGGSEILELKADGTCTQKIALKDGRTFSAQGTWEWKSDERYLSERILVTGIYSVLDEDNRIRVGFEKNKGIYQSFSAVRTLTGRVLLGYRGGTPLREEMSGYEKKASPVPIPSPMLRERKEVLPRMH